MNTFALVASWAHVLVPVEHTHCSVSGFRLVGNRDNWRRGATSGVQGAQTCRVLPLSSPGGRRVGPWRREHAFV